MKPVYTNENIMLLHSAKNFLALNGIESFIKNEHAIPNGARFGIENIFLELWLTNDQDFDKAEAIIEKQFKNSGTRPEWICARCDEPNDGSFDFCWKCQSAADTKA